MDADVVSQVLEKSVDWNSLFIQFPIVALLAVTVVFFLRRADEAQARFDAMNEKKDALFIHGIKEVQETLEKLVAKLDK